MAMCTYGYVGPWPSSMPAASQSDKFLVLGWVGYKWRMGYQRDPLVFSSSLYWTLLNYASSCCEYVWITHYQWSATMMLDQHELECTSQYWLDGWVWKTSQPFVRHLGNMWAKLVYHVLKFVSSSSDRSLSNQPGKRTSVARNHKPNSHLFGDISHAHMQVHVYAFVYTTQNSKTSEEDIPHIYIYIYTYICICICIYICINTNMRIMMYIHMQKYVYVCMYVCMYACMHAGM